MARLLFVRHAPTPETGIRLTGRLPGVSLAEEGIRVARATAERLAGVKLAAVYSSPVERTWQTAIEIGRPHRIDPIPHDGLLEVDYGDWAGRTLTSLMRLKAWRTVQLTPSRMRFPGGESLREAQERSVAACEEVARMHGKRTVALITHADIIKAAVSHFLGQPLDLFQRIGVAPGSVSAIDLPRQGIPRLVALNVIGETDSWR